MKGFAKSWYLDRKGKLPSTTTFGGFYGAVVTNLRTQNGQLDPRVPRRRTLEVGSALKETVVAGLNGLDDESGGGGLGRGRIGSGDAAARGHHHRRPPAEHLVRAVPAGVSRGGLLPGVERVDGGAVTLFVPQHQQQLVIGQGGRHVALQIHPVAQHADDLMNGTCEQTDILIHTQIGLSARELIFRMGGKLQSTLMRLYGNETFSLYNLFGIQIGLNLRTLSENYPRAAKVGLLHVTQKGGSKAACWSMRIWHAAVKRKGRLAMHAFFVRSNIVAAKVVGKQLVLFVPLLFFCYVIISETVKKTFFFPRDFSLFFLQDSMHT